MWEGVSTKNLNTKDTKEAQRNTKKLVKIRVRHCER